MTDSRFRFLRPPSPPSPFARDPEASAKAALLEVAPELGAGPERQMMCRVPDAGAPAHANARVRAGVRNPKQERTPPCA